MNCSQATPELAIACEAFAADAAAVQEQHAQNKQLASKRVLIPVLVKPRPLRPAGSCHACACPKRYWVTSAS